MKTEIKVIKALLEGREDLTIREISRKTGSDYRIVHTAVRELLKKRIAGKKEVGRAAQITLSGVFSSEVFLAEMERRGELLKNKNLKVMLETISRGMSTKLFVLLVFGSYAKGREKKGSDIDIMFIVADESKEREIGNIVSTIPLPIHHLVFSEKQFKSMKNSKEFNVVNEAIKNNILLHGIEEYYEMLPV